MSVEVSAVVGCVLGTAVGDAIGLPYEGLAASRAKKLLGPPDRHRLLLRYGMVSDDTEHTCMVAQALIASSGNIDLFQKQLARRLRFWLLGLPAGIGFATLRSILKLWLGVDPGKSGVFSAGNGPAMRAALLGAAIEDKKQLHALVKSSTQITHTDPKAEYGALAVALAAHLASRGTLTGEKFIEELSALLIHDGEELVAIMKNVVKSVNEGQMTKEFAREMGLSKGVTGYVYHTVPIALHSSLSYPNDYQSAIIDCVECGGDTDTVAAIVGGIIGSSLGKEGIPSEWLDSLCEWPRSATWMEQLASQLHLSLEKEVSIQSSALLILGVLLRNFVFLVVVLSHGIRRLFPPY